MPHKCPACQADVPGVVEQSVLEERLNAQKAGHTAALSAKDAAVAEAQRIAKAAQDEAKANAEAARVVASKDAEIADWRGKYEARVQTEARSEALKALKVDPAKLSGFEVFYNAEMAGKTDAEKVPFPDWLGTAKSNVLLAPHFPADGAPGADPAKPAAITDPAKPPAARPVVQPVVASPAPAGRKTKAEYDSYFESQEYKDLPADKKREKLAEAKREARAAAQPTV